MPFKIHINNIKTSLLLACFVPSLLFAQQILMFIPHDRVYYSEYIVMKEALEASGYIVDVRSSSVADSTTYMVPINETIDGTANKLTGGSYAQFQTHYQQTFNIPWDDSLNNMPIDRLIAVDGLIQDIADMSSYQALVVVGGDGAINYRVDGDYPDLDIQMASEKLNQLALNALSQNKPVIAQCHGASIPAFWRIPNTSGTGAEALGYSLLKQGHVTGYPNSLAYTEGLDITPRAEDRVTISSPHQSFYDDFGAPPAMGVSKIITTRNWYPQTVTYAAKTLLNILNSYPTQLDLITSIDTLIIHGGPLTIGVPDTSACGISSRNDVPPNDIPCNHGGGVNLPADFTDIVTVLENNSATDPFAFNVGDVNIYDVASLPFDINDKNSTLAYLENFQSVIFFKHWSDGVTQELQQALVEYTDNGGTLLGLHHAAFNDIRSSSENKNILVEIFGVQSTLPGFGAANVNQELIMSQYGHFITSYSMTSTSINSPVSRFPNSDNSSFPNGANISFSNHHSFSIFDEIYYNWELISGQSFGSEVNQISPLLRHSYVGMNNTIRANVFDSQNFAGMTKRYNPSLDASIGHVIFLMSGERQESLNSNHPYGQLIRNSAAWINSESPTNVNSIPQITSSNSISVLEGQTNVIVITANDPEGDSIDFTISGGADAAFFGLTLSGILSFNSATVYVEGNNDYNLIIRATDNGIPPLFAEQTLTITVLSQSLFANGFE